MQVKLYVMARAAFFTMLILGITLGISACTFVLGPPYNVKIRIQAECTNTVPVYDPAGMVDPDQVRQPCTHFDK